MTQLPGMKPVASCCRKLEKPGTISHLISGIVKNMLCDIKGHWQQNGSLSAGVTQLLSVQGWHGRAGWPHRAGGAGTGEKKRLLAR